MTKWLDDDRTRRKLGAGTALFVIVVGLLVLLIAGIRFITHERGIGLVEPGITLVAAGLASLVVVIGVTAWAEQRDQDRQRAEYRNREQYYEGIARVMLSRFPGQAGGNYDAQQDRELRTSAALWASNDVVTKLAAWQAELTAIMAAHDVSSGTITPTPAESLAVKERFGDAVVAMRSDLASATTDTISTDVVLKSIFNE